MPTVLDSPSTTDLEETSSLVLFFGPPESGQTREAMESRASFSGEGHDTTWIRMPCEAFEALSNRPRNGGPSDLDIALSEVLEYPVTVARTLKGDGLVHGQKVPLLSINPLEIRNELGRPIRRIFEDDAVVQSLAACPRGLQIPSWNQVSPLLHEQASDQFECTACP